MIEFVASNLTLDPQARKERARAKTLRVDDLVKPNPHTPAQAAGPKVAPDERLRKKRQHSKMTEELRNGSRKLNDGPRDERGEIAAKMRSRSIVTDSGDFSVKKTANGVFDLWEERADELAKHEAFEKEYGFEEDWFQPMRKKTKLYAADRAAAVTKRSGRAAVEVAAPGASYHPDYESHQELLQDALDFWTKRAENSKKTLNRMPRLKTAAEPVVFEDSDEEEEVAAGSEPDEEEEEVTKENIAHIPRKSKEEIRKSERRFKHERRLAAIEQRKEQNRQYTAINAMVRDLDDAERVREAARQAREELEEDRNTHKIARIGPLHYQHRAPEVLLTEELPGSFRSIKPVSSVLEDRYASFQRRNLVETRYKKTKRASTADVKSYTKKSFRDAPDM